MRKLVATLAAAFALAGGLALTAGSGTALAHDDGGGHHHGYWYSNYQRDDHRTYDDHRTCAAEDSLNLLTCPRIDVL